jgi:hypothetical protein
MNRRKNSGRTNGQAVLHGHSPNRRDRLAVHGHATASTERGGIPAHGDQAASDDASGTIAVETATHAADHATRGATADAAPPSPPGDKEQVKEDLEHKKYLRALLAKPTDSAAMQDAAAYVDAVAVRVDLVAASVRCLTTQDEKIAKAELDRLREMKFGKVAVAAAGQEESPRIEFGDLPRPVR